MRVPHGEGISFGGSVRLLSLLSDKEEGRKKKRRVSDVSVVPCDGDFSEARPAWFGGVRDPESVTQGQDDTGLLVLNNPTISLKLSQYHIVTLQLELSGVFHHALLDHRLLWAVIISPL